MGGRARASSAHLIAAVAAGILLAACGGPSDTTGPGLSDNEKTGATAGAAAGAAASVMLMAAGPVGMAVGAASGALKGNRVGNYLDGDEKIRADSAARKAAATGKTVKWQKTDFLFRTESSGWAKPVAKAYRDDGGRLCRKIAEAATKDGKTKKDTIVLCRASKGWEPLQLAGGGDTEAAQGAAPPASGQ